MARNGERRKRVCVHEKQRELRIAPLQPVFNRREICRELSDSPFSPQKSRGNNCFRDVERNVFFFFFVARGTDRRYLHVAAVWRHVHTHLYFFCLEFRRHRCRWPRRLSIALDTHGAVLHIPFLPPIRLPSPFPTVSSVSARPGGGGGGGSARK